MPIDKLGIPKPVATERPDPLRPASAASATKAYEAAAQEKQTQPPTLETIQRVAAQLDTYMKSVGRKIEFKVDGDSGRTVITVRDSETGELIRQMPSEEVLKLARVMDTNSLFVSLTV